MILRERRKPPAAASSSSNSEEEYCIGLDALEQMDKALANLEEEQEEHEEEDRRRPSNAEARPRRARQQQSSKPMSAEATSSSSPSSSITPSPSPSSPSSSLSDESSEEGPDLEGATIVARTMRDDELWLLVKPKDEAWNKVLWAPYEVCCEEDSAFKQRYSNFKRKYRESEGPHAVDFVPNRKDRSTSTGSSADAPAPAPPAAAAGAITRSTRASMSGSAVIDMPQKELLEVLVERGVINEEWLAPDHLLTFSKVGDSKVWLVQWGGLPVSEATWEDESPTDTPQELIDEWNKWNDAARKHRWQKIADDYIATHGDEIEDREEIAASKRVKKRGRPPKHKKPATVSIEDIRRPKDIADKWTRDNLCTLAAYTPTPSPPTGGATPSSTEEGILKEEKTGEKTGEEDDADEMVYRPTRDTLFGFQVEGIQWLLHNWSQSRGSVLADEMGMGKTVQTAVFLSAVMSTVGGGHGKASPASAVVCFSKRELQKWAPELNVVVMAGSSEDRDTIADFDMSWINTNNGHREKEPLKHRTEPQFCPKFDVVVTSYELFLACSSRSGLTSLTNYNWRVLVLDEGHRVKNHLSHSSKALAHIANVQHTVILTGTPIQNNLRELWSILHLVDKKRFSTYEEVEAELQKDTPEDGGTAATPTGEESSEEKKSVHDSVANLDLDKVTEVLRPYMLRRYKSDAMKKVPPKLEHIIEVEFTTLQRRVYKSVYEGKIYSLVRGKGGKSSLNNIAMELRKCCAHPYLISGVEDSHLEALGVEPDSAIAMQNLTEMSGKLVFLEKLIPQLREKKEKLLIFSQFKIVLDIIEDWLNWKKLPTERLDGSVSGAKRQAAIDRFNDKKHDSFAFLLTTRAGGVGINLTSASVVVIYDSDWNPQNDNQAQARCHRIGQTKTVRVYRLLTRDSYEQKLFEIASKKLGLEQAIMSSVTANSELNLSKQELEHLIKEGAYAAFEDHSSREEQFRTASLDDIMSSDRIKTVTYGTMVSGGHRSRFSKAYFSANPETPEEMATSPDSVESGEDGAAECAHEKLSDIEFWRKLVHDEALLTTDPDAKEEKSESSIHDVGERSIRKTRYAGNFLRFRTARTDKEDRVDQEYEPQESLSENGDSDVDVEDLVDEEEALDKAMKASRKKKRGRGRGKKDAAAGQTSTTAVKEGVGRGSHKRARVDMAATTPALQRAVAAAAAAQKAKAFASASSSSSYPSIPRRTAGSSSFTPQQQQQQQQQQQLPTMGVTSATYPYIPAPPRYPYAAVQYRGMPLPPHSIANHNMPNSRLLFPPPPMYQCAPNYGMMYGMYVASRTAAAAAAAAGERNLQHTISSSSSSSRPPMNPDEFLTSVDPSKIERLD